MNKTTIKTLFALLVFAVGIAYGEDHDYLATTYLDHPTSITYTDNCVNDEGQAGYTVNFEDVPVTQLIRFLSQIGKLNFVFDSKELDFNVTIVSEESTSVDDLLTALLQVLKVYGFNVAEQGHNIVIYNTKKDVSLSKLSSVITDHNAHEVEEFALVTRVFGLEMLLVTEAAQIIKPLLSKDAIVEVSPSTKHLIVTDFTSNVQKVNELILALDQPADDTVIREYKTKIVDPETLISYASKVLGKYLKQTHLEMIPQPASGAIYLVGPPKAIQKTIHILSSLDTADLLAEQDFAFQVEGEQFEVYHLKHLRADRMIEEMKLLAKSLSSESSQSTAMVKVLTTAFPMHGGESIMLAGSTRVIDALKPLLAQIDRSIKQVYIEMLVIDVDLNNSLNFGVEWVALGDEQDKLAYASGFLGESTGLLTGAQNASSTTLPSPARSVTSSGGTSGFSGDVPLNASQFGLGVVGNILRHNGTSLLTLGALVTAIESDVDTSIVLHPRVMVENGDKASIFVGQNIPYQKKTLTSAENSLVTTDLDYEDVGVTVKVRPIIGPNNIVSLEIHEEISEVTNTTVNISSDTFVIAPTTNKTTTQTKVHVPDGCFLVMSGHVKDKGELQKKGIPCLGSLPWIGSVFSRTYDSRQKRNLIMFIRPHVISDSEDAVWISNQEGYHFNYEGRPESLKQTTRDFAPECQSLRN